MIDIKIMAVAVWTSTGMDGEAMRIGMESVYVVCNAGGIRPGKPDGYVGGTHGSGGDFRKLRSSHAQA